MPDSIRRTPPKPTGDLAGVFGKREMEHAALAIWNKAHAEGSWDLDIDAVISASCEDNDPFTRCGMLLLIGDGWIVFDDLDEVFRVDVKFVEKLEASAECLT